MRSETRTFLRGRASTETSMAAQTGRGPAGWSHSHLARLYLERCIEVEGDVKACVGCDVESDCLSLRSEREARCHVILSGCSD
jgi:hypothetical protein